MRRWVVQHGSRRGVAAVATVVAGVGVGVAGITGPNEAVADKEKMPSSFDPEALERGAKALREIQSSEHAKKVIELARQQEATKQQEAQQKEAEANQQAQQMKVEQEKVHWDEMRKTNQQQSEQRAQLAKYEDDLARKRQQDEAEQQRNRNAEFVKMQEESAERQEALRRQTEEKRQREQRETARVQAEAEREKVRAQALAEAEGRAKEARENEDVQRRQLETRLQYETERAKQVVETTLSGLGNGFRSLVEDRARMGSLALGVAMLGAGLYGTRESAKVGARVLERFLSQPALVRDSSRRSGLKSLFGGSKAASTSGNEGKVLGDVVLEDFVQERLEQLAAAARRARSRGAPMRNILFYGPPGTGKTMVARRLAKHAGMEYAVVNGGDVAPLESAASPKLHELFDWAERSKTGTVLFIDEADAFLSRRGSAESDASRSAVNTLLARTGSQGRNVMLVLATNRPFDLDAAVVDRMDDAMEIGLPGEQERQRLLSLYFRKYIEGQHHLAESDEPADAQRVGGLFGQRAQPPPAIDVVDVDVSDLQQLAQKTNGFSGRELAKLIGAMQAAAFGSQEGQMTRHLFWSIANLKLSEHNMREAIVSEGGVETEAQQQQQQQQQQ